MLKARAISKIGKIKAELVYYRRLATDSRTPAPAKCLLLVALGYLAMPFDLIPDFIPVIGYLDDLVIVPLLIWLAVKCIPANLKREIRISMAAIARKK